MTEPICEVIITADSEEWLINFTRSLVRDRLAACGQRLAQAKHRCFRSGIESGNPDYIQWVISQTTEPSS